MKFVTIAAHGCLFGHGDSLLSWAKSCRTCLRHRYRDELKRYTTINPAERKGSRSSRIALQPQRLLRKLAVLQVGRGCQSDRSTAEQLFVFVPLMMTVDNPLRCQNIFLYEEAEEREKTIALTVGHVVLSSLEINAHILPSPPLYIFYAKENGHLLPLWNK